MFYAHEVRNLLRAGNFRTPARPAGFENFKLWSIGGRADMSAGGNFCLCPWALPTRLYWKGRPDKI
jgi:hypothetical protein